MKIGKLPQLGWSLLLCLASLSFSDIKAEAQGTPVLPTDVTVPTSGGGVVFNLGLDQAFTQNGISQPRRTRSVIGRVRPRQKVQVITLPMVTPYPAHPSVRMKP